MATSRPAASAIAILRAGKAKEIQWPLECALLAPQQFQSGISIKLIPSVWMGIIGNIGRMYEPALIVGRNFSTGKLFQDTSYGVPYITKQKLKLIQFLALLFPV